MNTGAIGAWGLLIATISFILYLTTLCIRVILLFIRQFILLCIGITKGIKNFNHEWKK